MVNNLNICLITSPRPPASVVPLGNVIDILREISSFLFLITGNDGETVLKNRKHLNGYSINHHPKSFFLIKILGHLFLEIRIVCAILKIKSQIDVYIFFMGESLLLPLLYIKLLRKPVILFLAGSSPNIHKHDHSLLTKIYVSLEKINYRLANNLVVYSNRLIKAWDLEKYRKKVFIAYEHHIDFNKFKYHQPLLQRKCLVGYIGRLSEEKGVLNLILAMPNIINMNKDLSLFIGGDGPLKKVIENNCVNSELYNKLIISGWISHDELSKYLNELKLLVLPSYTEGLPNIMLEAMACGTPVLATPVGAIPDYIKDGETGFLMENNTPECIAENVIRALNHPHLEQISENGRILVAKEFTYEKAVKRYKNILMKN